MRVRISAMMAGIIIAATAVVAQAVFAFSPPQAYGICLVCHARDLLSQLGRLVFNQPFALSEIARNGPVLTVVGILAGAFIGAITSKEWKPKWVESKTFSFAIGFVVAVLALIISGCPIRLLLRTGYGELNALLGVIFLILGSVAGTYLLKRKRIKRP